jgi:hypothetical protein
LWLAEKVVDNSRWTLDVANAALKGAEAVVDNSRWPLDVAINFLEGVKVAVKAGAEAAKFIVNLGLGGLIDIRLIEFDINIGLVSSGNFMGRLEVSFLRRAPKSMSFNLRLKSIKDMALDLADAVFPGISGRKKREVDESLKRSLPDYSRRHYLPQMYIYRPGNHESPLPEPPKHQNRKESQSNSESSVEYQFMCSEETCRVRFVATRQAADNFDKEVEAVNRSLQETKRKAYRYIAVHIEGKELKQNFSEPFETPPKSDIQASGNGMLLACKPERYLL